MPPQTPSVSTGAWRGVLLFLFGFLVGVVVAVPSFLIFLTSSAGIGIVTQYLSAPPPLPQGTIAQPASTTELIAQLSQGATGIPVPKGSASVAYVNALNSTVRDISVLAASSSELSTVLAQIQNQSLARNYNGLIDLVVKAKVMLGTQKDRVATFGADLTTLSEVNQSTPDATTKAATDDLVSRGNALQSSLQTLTTGIDALLSGAPPTAQQIADIQAESNTAATQATDFINALKTLEQHFGIPQQ